MEPLEKVVIIDDLLFEEHIPWVTFIPECKERVIVIREILLKLESPLLEWVKPQPIERTLLEEIHTIPYINHVIARCQEADPLEESTIGGDASVRVTHGSLQAILCAAGSGIQAVDILQRNESRRVFCNIRPPGHHAMRDRGRGFCLFNNIMLAARYALKKAERVVIVDWDVHHGNGTESMLRGEDEENLLFINIQQTYHTIWPGSGKPSQSNYNLEPGSGDDEVKKLFEGLSERLREFGPSLILVSCGFDAHQSDRISELKFSSSLSMVG